MINKVRMNSERLLILDIAKGIGILLVVVGHLIHSSTLPGMYIYQFHMPFFFLISGYCYNSEKYTGHLGTLVKVRGMQLLVPLACFNLLLMCCSFQIYPDYTAASYSDHMIGATWFLLVLFGATILYSIVDNVSVLYVKTIILLALLFCGCTLSYYEINPPYGIAAIPSAAFYFGVGSLLKGGDVVNYVLRKSVTFKGLLFVVMFIIMSLVSFLRIDQIRLPEHISILSAIIPFAGITFSFLLSGWISRFDKCQKALSWLGQNTLAILCSHLFYITLCSEFLKPSIPSYPVYKVIELLVVFVATIVTAIVVKRYFPFMLGKN